MKLRDFVDLFTVIVYHANERDPGNYFLNGVLLADYGLDFKESWFPIIFEDGIFHQRFRSVRGPGDFNFQSVQIVAEGIRWIEDNVGESNLEVYLRRSGLRIPGDDGLDDLAAVNLLTAKIAPASDREVSFGDNKGARDDLVAEIAKAEEAIRGSNEMRADEKSDSLISLDLGKSLILKSINFSIGAVRYLILDRIKKAFEKVIEDVFRIALILCFIAIATAIVALI